MKPTKPSVTAHFIVACMAFTSIVLGLILLVQLFKGASEAERAWDALADWVENVLAD